jgi:hypothetical protein
MKEKWLLEKREVEGKTFYLLKVGSGRHGKPSFVVWVSPKLVTQTQDGFFLELPIENVDLTMGKKDLILRSGNNNLFNVFVRCGYRGGSEIEILTPGSVFEYQVWSSPQGSLGISRGALVLTSSSSVKYKWKRTGRTYGSPTEGVSIIYLDGRKVDLEGGEEDALASIEEE